MNATSGLQAHNLRIVVSDDGDATKYIVEAIERRYPSSQVLAGSAARNTKDRNTIDVAVGPAALNTLLANRTDGFIISVFTSSQVYREPVNPPRRLSLRSVCLNGAAIAVALTSVAATISSVNHASGHRTMVRNFYGSLTIDDVDNDGHPERQLLHGAILHGAQYLDNERRRWPTTYYGDNGGAGMAVLANRQEGQKQRVGVIGLGAGTMAAYGRAGDYYRFYEINPLVIQLARSQFTFLADSPAIVEIAVGDARLSLEREQPQQFDVLVADAFSGDSIPVHLLTREAFAVYFRHVKAGGILAVHISNRNLDLAPVVKLSSDYYGRQARLVDAEPDESKGRWGWCYSPPDTRSPVLRLS